jgi:hypothetical protein
MAYVVHQYSRRLHVNIDEKMNKYERSLLAPTLEIQRLAE